MKSKKITMALVALGLLGGAFCSEATLTQYQAAVQAEASLISHYKFDAGNANDNFGSHNGTLYNTAGFATGVGGGSDQALNLDGVSSDNLGAVSAFDFTSGAGTVEMWVRAGWADTAETWASRSIVGNTAGYPTMNYTLSMSVGKSAIILWNGNGWDTMAIPAPGTGWHHMAVVFNANSWTLIWDGVNQGTHASAGVWPGFSGNSTTLGSDAPSGGVWLSTPWIGNLDEAAFYSSALALGSVQAHRTAFYATVVPPAVAAYQAAVLATPGLISYYKFDADNATDDFGANNGTLYGSAGFATGVGGGADRALNLDGSASSDNLGAVPALDFTSGTGTVEMWVRAGWTPDASSRTMVGNFGSVPPYFNYTIAMMGDKSAILFWNGAVYQTVALPSNASTNWHHLAMVFDAGTWTLVWDGINLGTVVSGWNGFGGNSTTLGSDMPWGAGWVSAPWIGNLDEVAFYSSALSVSSIQAHHTAYTGVSTPVLVTQPLGGILPVGEHFQMSGSGTGGNLIYAWRKNGSVISGATNSTLDFPSTSTADTGAYQLVITNSAGSAISAMAQVAVLAPNLGSYRAKVTAESSLVSYYKYDGSTYNDDIGINHGVLGGGVTAFDASFGGSPTNKALDLFSTGNPADYSWVEVGSAPQLQFADGTGTVEFWMQCNWTNGTYSANPVPAVGSYWPGIICCREQSLDDSVANENYAIMMNADKTGIFLWNGTYHPVTLPTPAGDSWHHCAAVFTTASGGSCTLIWDGVPLITFTGVPMGQDPLATMHIGASASWGRAPFLGKLDEIAFYADALSTSAVQDHVRAAFGLGSHPVINTTRAGNYVALSWVDPGNWVLESTPQLSPASWTPVQTNGSPVVIQTDGNKFFRLKAQ